VRKMPDFSWDRLDSCDLQRTQMKIGYRSLPRKIPDIFSFSLIRQAFQDFFAARTALAAEATFAAVRP
jgi:hypothetical protein